MTQSPYPNWTYGQGVPNHTSKAHHEIDPYAPDHPMVNNYRLLVSGIAPPAPSASSAPSRATEKTSNLAPFSYFQVVEHDPPTFIVGFSSRPGPVKDTYRNLKETGGCWSGRFQACRKRRVRRLGLRGCRSRVFSVEGKVVVIKEFEAHEPGMSAPAVVLIRATRFWMQEGAVDAEFSHIELEKLRPVAQLGGVAYGRITETFERPRKRWEDEIERSELRELKEQQD
ncbi:uncharacterized protein BO80DRAFT_497580 [Aspergillus ibericus CBS 121593]|uniref:Flavin reductase like domain-containing protein n=1 Tax=Aspergillus ibericus CBS 121593 TaxID=1448316 RepID=A0A395GJN7_9EURO|nr:hypothetical protein BO80DRAFT_497580 [Aspergillus ibericus CBS 121593]RAK95701.1 hypothetical protein BO80DRAFT_497580 [Aspergillus ibericus CBS 121593]